MPYVNIPETGLDASIAQQIGKLKGQFQSKVQETLGSIQSELQNGCPSPEQLQSIINRLNSVKDLSTNISSRLNRIRKLIGPLRTGSSAILSVVTLLKGLPIPGIALTAGVTSTFSDLLHLAKEFGTQLNTSATSIESLLNQTEALNNLLRQASELSAKVDLILEFCSLSNETGQDLPAECIDAIANGTTEEAAKCISDLNNILGSNLEAENKLKATLGTGLVDQGLENYTGPDGTVYTIRVIEVSSNYTRAPKRQAIAENEQGVKKFESDASFSSSVGVLKRQVKFRIDNSQV